MSPNPQYVVGKEHGAGTEGYAPILLWPIWGPFIAWVIACFPITYDSSLITSLESVILWFCVVTFICLIALLTFQWYVKRRYHTEFSDQRFEEIVNQAKSRMKYTFDFEIWLLPGMKQVLMGNAGFLHSALVVSEPVIQDILAKPEEGEVILASAVKRLNVFQTINTWVSIGLLILMTSLQVLYRLTFPLIAGVWIVMAWTVCILCSSPMFMRSNREKSNDVQKEYGIHPNAARLIVFRGIPPTDREIQKYITRKYGVFDNYTQYRRALVIFAVSIIASIFVSVLFYILLLGITHPFLTMVEGIRVTITFLVSILVFVVLYFGLVSHFIPELE